MNIAKNTARILYWIGVCLLVLNMLGFVIPLRNPNIYTEHGTDKLRPMSLTEKQFYETLNSLEFSSTEQHVRGIADTVHIGMTNVLLSKGISDYNFRVPLHENYLLYIASYLNPNAYLVYNFCSAKRAIERGAGLCSQQVGVLSAILQEHSIPSKTVGLDGHTVALVEVNSAEDHWWIVDPDYGVIIPHTVEQIEHNPALIAPFYEEKGYPPDTVQKLITIFEAEGNVVVDRYQSAYFTNICITEKFAYIAKWAIPILLMLPTLLFWRKKHRKKT